MVSHFPIWIQRLPADLRRRLELAEATAREARRETHARQALELVGVLATRMPFDDALDRYLDIMGLGAEEGAIVRSRALVALNEHGPDSELVRERHRVGWEFDWRYATPLGAVRFVRRHLRRNAEEDLWLELSAARAEEALILTHLEHALRFVALLAREIPPPRSVTLYLDRLEVPAVRARSVYQRALARVAEQHLPRTVSAPAEEPAR
jgi:hypothetical protein